MIVPSSTTPDRARLGRAGCLPAVLAAAPFFLVALVCIVLSFMAFSAPVSRHPVGPPTTPVMPVTSTTLSVGTTEPAGGSGG
jgi:hypothetical protein